MHKEDESITDSSSLLFALEMVSTKERCLFAPFFRLVAEDGVK